MNKHFYVVSSEKNPNNSNLTELNAFDSVDNGFATHSDWIGHMVRYNRIMDVIDKRKALTVLDVGCGSLQQIKFVWRNRSPFAGTYVGLDLRANEKWLDKIKWSRGEIHLVKMDILDDNLPSNLPEQYDVVICTEVLEHVPVERAQELLNRLYAWTENDGICMLSSPNAGVSKSTAENHKDENGVSREWPYYRKIQMAEEAGFDIRNTWGTFCALRNIPESFMNLPEIQTIRKTLPYSWFSTFAANAFPEQSNNCMMEMTK